MNQSANHIRIVMIIGTARPGNFTSKAAVLVVDELKAHPGVHVEVFDPRHLKVAFPGSEDDDPSVQRLRDAVKSATGVVFATPEYHGSFSSMTKLIIENLGFPSVLSGKPVALLGIAAGQIGAIKALEHLRSVCSHVGAIVLPGPVSVARVRTLFDEEGHCLDGKTEAAIRGVGTRMLDYVRTQVCPRIALEAMVRS